MLRRLIASPLLLLLTILFVSPGHAQQNVELVNSGHILLEGDFYYSIGKFSKAENLYLKVGRNDTNYAEVLRDLALTYSEDKEDSLCASVCRRGLALHSEYEPDFYSLLGISLKEMEKYDTALKTFDQGMALYPHSYVLPYQKGLTYFKMKKYTEAQQQFQQAITLNPYHASSHFMLGKTCAEQGRIVTAILSYEFYLMLEPASERSAKVVAALEDLYTGDYQADPDLKVDPEEAGDKCFADIEELITSQVALSPGYKNKTKINLKLVKQCQAMLEKLHYEPNTGNWWMENYVPFFVELQQKNYFVPFVSFSLFPVAGNNPTVAKSIRKNKTKIKEFATWAGKYLKEHQKHPARELFTDKEKLSCIFYDNHMIAGVGHSGLNDVPVGEWYYFYSRGGRKLAYGKFDEKGKRQGEWTWYFSNGNIREKTNYVNGLREGPSEEYFNNGVLGFKCTYSKDLVEGEYSVYEIHGGLKETANMKAGKLNGPATGYYSNGAKSVELNYVLGKLSGEAVYYTVDGKAYSRVNYLNDKRSGHSTEHYSSGQLHDEGDYKNGEPFGPWKVYWDNGKLQREGVFKDKGLRNGMWKEYYRSGTLSAESMYKDGKHNGEMKLYDVDGKLYCIAVYAAGKIKKETFFDKDGKEIASYNIGKETTVTEYYPNGEKAAEGDYVNGERDGEWKLYDRDGGYMTNKEYYSKGELNGLRKEYFPNGKEKSELEFSHDERDGYLKTYFPNGTIESEGWFVKGDRQGDWYFYNERGIVVSHNYYLNDEEHGYQESFDNKGRKNEEIFIRNSCTWTRTRYDSTGAVSYRYESVNGTGTYEYKFPTGQAWISQEYKNGQVEGTTIRYDFHGNKVIETNFMNGDQQGLRKEYYENSGKPFVEVNYVYDLKMGASTAWWENGNKRWELNYYAGKLDGPQKYYHKNGKLQKENNFDLGTVDGEVKYYAENGDLQIIYYYRQGVMLGYSYFDKDGKPVPMIAIKRGTGKIAAYYQNGNKSLEAEYDNGELTGHVVEYYPDGKVSDDETYDYGDYTGPQKYYYPNGNLQYELNYYNDQPDGTWKYYYENGQLEHTEVYLLGDNFGTWIYYTEDGKEKVRKVYYDDRQLSETTPAPEPPVQGKTKK